MQPPHALSLAVDSYLMQPWYLKSGGKFKFEFQTASQILILILNFNRGGRFKFELATGWRKIIRCRLE